MTPRRRGRSTQESRRWQQRLPGDVLLEAWTPRFAGHVERYLARLGGPAMACRRCGLDIQRGAPRVCAVVLPGNTILWRCHPWCAEADGIALDRRSAGESI